MKFFERKSEVRSQKTEAEWDGIPDDRAGMPDKKQLIAAWYWISGLIVGMQSLELRSA